jgi:excisionase family DNA binding protein
MMSMRRTRRAGGAGAVGPDVGPVREGPIPLDPLSLITGIAPGIVLEGTVSPDGSVRAVAPLSVDEVGRLLRCSEATVRRLIRTAVLRPVGVGERWVRRSDVESYRQSLHRRVPGKPGD